jgi:AcrR family transcriptional regulator
VSKDAKILNILGMALAQPTVLSRKRLYQRIWSDSISVVAKEMGLSNNALAKICNRLLVPYPTRGYWNKVNAGKRVRRVPLPAAPDLPSEQVTISALPAASRRERTRLTPEMRRTQLLTIAADIVRAGGLHAANLKRIAATAGISETQAYNYFPTREKLLAALAIAEFEKIQAARLVDIGHAEGHYAKIIAGTRTYLHQIDQRGGLLQMLLSNPDVREAVQKNKEKRSRLDLDNHVDSLVRRYGISRETALGLTVVLSRLCIRAGKLIADRRISLQAAERLCLSIVVEGSRAVTGADDRIIRRAQRAKAA